MGLFLGSVWSDWGETVDLPPYSIGTKWVHRIMYGGHLEQCESLNAKIKEYSGQSIYKQHNNLGLIK